MSVETRNHWQKVRRAELQYGRNLRKIARHVGDIVSGFDVENPLHLAEMMDAMLRYARILGPWARATAARMLADVSRRDATAWKRYSKQLGLGIQDEIRFGKHGQQLQAILQENVDLITSLPTKAAERVHRLTTEGLSESRRAEDIAEEILNTESVTKSRATLIARTEVSRTASTFTMVRAQGVGSTGYIWRTAKDARVRPSHHGMEGKFILWADEPILDNMRGHAGCFPNCRCYPEPVIPGIS